MVLLLSSFSLPYPINFYSVFFLSFGFLIITSVSGYTATKKVLFSHLRTVPLEQKGNFFDFLYLKWHILILCTLVDLLGQGHIVLGTVTLGVVVEYAHAACSSLIEFLTLAYGRVIEVFRSLCKQQFLDLFADTPLGLLGQQVMATYFLVIRTDDLCQLLCSRDRGLVGDGDNQLVSSNDDVHEHSA